MTSGAGGGMSGRRRWPDEAIGFAWLAVVTASVNTVNVLNVLHEYARAGEPLPWWQPAVWEGTSGLALLAAAFIPMLMVARFPPGRPRPLRSLLAHLAATLAFSLAHVGLMIVLRELLYALAGESYSFAGGAASLPYEYRKDLISYAVMAALFWTIPRLRRRPEPELPAVLVPPDLIEIDEGQRLIRVPRSSVLCARSSGNYVEFFLADGRRPLMRTTLTRVEGLLAGAGFVRTHRSWLANPAHVVEAVAEGSGDYGLKLADGTEVPLSRRYPEALASLRGSLARAN